MNRSLLKRCLGAFVGLVYAVLYGFWTAFITGGGHGNFLWFFLFFFTFFFGLFFPVMGFIVVNLRPFWAKVSFAAILCLHFIATFVLFLPLMFEDASMMMWGNTSTAITDIYKSWERSNIFFILMTAIHILPVLIFTILLLKSIFLDKRENEDEPKSYMSLQ